MKLEAKIDKTGINTTNIPSGQIETFLQKEYLKDHALQLLMDK